MEREFVVAIAKTDIKQLLKNNEYANFTAGSSYKATIIGQIAVVTDDNKNKVIFELKEFQEVFNE